MTEEIVNATASNARRPSRFLVAVAVLSITAVACTETDPSTDEVTDPSTSPAPPTNATETTVDKTETTRPTTTQMITRSAPPIPLEADDRVFQAGTDIVVVAHAPPPWTPFPVSSLGMRRDGGTAEWVGISFWDPTRVATDSCRWKDSWETPGESVDELAEALAAITGRQATAPVPVTVGGYEGLYLEWSLPADLDVATCDDATTVAWSGAGKRRSHDIPGLIDRIWILDIDGHRILIDAISLPGEQEAIRRRVDEVIDSLRFAAVT